MRKISIKNHGVEVIKDRLYSRSQFAESVYGEKIIKKHEYFLHAWEPKKSKLSAAISDGISRLPIEEDTETLYLGASSGTTVSHISDISNDGKIFAIEVAPEPFSKLLNLSENRRNIYPVMANARIPDEYSFFLGHSPDFIYQDISQKDQTEILLRNMDAFPEWNYAIYMLKAISIDSARKPDDVLNEQISKLKKRKGIKIIETINISNFHRGHFCILLQNIT
ncbi:MAG: fibrillarin-like rRNA/tRNA 2'-O-methyltransferase [Candidatus Thermoplasmatota archaeon]|nr:fibrillarin-like rRNA/tRNA 2'-O-methyltransferase [Candidatus Thermoplasmatota archaeon]MCL5790653.1 fibrillarin-like rRNA/tRNA 2'-O-methyltransferase [Candidatus Thermoplasmatota archaeon]